MKYIIENVNNGFIDMGVVKSGEVREMIKEIINSDREYIINWWNEYCGVDNVEGIVGEIMRMSESDKEDGIFEDYFWDEDSVLRFEE